MSDDNAPSVSFDREIWRSKEEDYYSPSIHVTPGGGIAINVGGTVLVHTVEEWHKVAERAAEARADADISKRVQLQLSEALKFANEERFETAAKLEEMRGQWIGMKSEVQVCHAKIAWLQKASIDAQKLLAQFNP